MILAIKILGKFTMRRMIFFNCLVFIQVISSCLGSEEKSFQSRGVPRFDVEVDFDVSMGFVQGEDWFKKKHHPQVKEFMDFLRSLYEKNNLEKLTSQKEAIIPKRIHQIWLGKNKPPEKFKEWQKTIKSLHPGWEYKLWTDADVADLELYNKKFYDESKNYGERSDILRYELLYKFGGVYIDIDFELLRPLDILHHTYDFYVGIGPLKMAAMLANGIVASVPGHPILKHCIETLKKSWGLFKKGKAGVMVILSRSGPYHFERAFWDVCRDYDGKFIALPKSFFYPFDKGGIGKLIKSGRQVYDLVKPETFAIHYWTTLWFSAKVKNSSRSVSNAMK